MPRTPIVAGNWKMNKTADEAVALVDALLPGLTKLTGVETVICPPYVGLVYVARRLAGTGIAVGAQNMHWEESGAYTGEVSPQMLRPLCSFVILGHSERRAHFGESDDMVNRKVQAALKHGLQPILCVGETLAENEAGRTAEIVDRQVRAGLAGINAREAAMVTIAYEPVWAIGTGRAATAQGANALVAGVLRPALSELFGSEVAGSVRVQYGGSVTAANAAEFFRQPEIDGALVGGASLKADEFVKIVAAAAH
jgi:triosephosphate isomerase